MAPERTSRLKLVAQSTHFSPFRARVPIESSCVFYAFVSSLTFSHRNESESRGDAFDEEENKGGREEAGLLLK